MAKHDKLGLVLVASLVAVIGASGLVVAQAMWRSPDQRYDRDIPLEYRLNQEQAREMDEIRTEYQEKILPLEKQLAAKRVELKAMRSRSDVRSSRVRDLLREIHELEFKIEGLRLEANEMAANLLSADQRRFYGGTFDVLGDSGSSCPMNRQDRSGGMQESGHHGSKMMSGGQDCDQRGMRQDTMSCNYC